MTKPANPLTEEQTARIAATLKVPRHEVVEASLDQIEMRLSHRLELADSVRRHIASVRDEVADAR
jgi:hypothetical protein